MKHLDFISNPRSSADWCNQESVAMGVKWLFVNEFLHETRLGDRLKQSDISTRAHQHSTQVYALILKDIQVELKNGQIPTDRQ